MTQPLNQPELLPNRFERFTASTRRYVAPAVAVVALLGCAESGQGDTSPVNTVPGVEVDGTTASTTGETLADPTTTAGATTTIGNPSTTSEGLTPEEIVAQKEAERKSEEERKAEEERQEVEDKVRKELDEEQKKFEGLGDDNPDIEEKASVADETRADTTKKANEAKDKVNPGPEEGEDDSNMHEDLVDDEGNETRRGEVNRLADDLLNRVENTDFSDLMSNYKKAEEAVLAALKTGDLSSLEAAAEQLGIMSTSREQMLAVFDQVDADNGKAKELLELADKYLIQRAQEIQDYLDAIAAAEKEKEKEEANNNQGSQGNGSQGGNTNPDPDPEPEPEPEPDPDPGGGDECPPGLVPQQASDGTWICV